MVEALSWFMIEYICSVVAQFFCMHTNVYHHISVAPPMITGVALKHIDAELPENRDIIISWKVCALIQVFQFLVVGS